MKRIIGTPSGSPYLGVEVDDKMLRIVLMDYAPNWTITLDKKVIPQLIEFLKDSLNERS